MNPRPTLPPEQTQGRHEKGRGKGKTKIGEPVVHGLRKTRVLHTLSYSQLMDQSRCDCSRRKSTYVAKTGSIYKQWSHSISPRLARLEASTQLEFRAGVVLAK